MRHEAGKRLGQTVEVGAACPGWGRSSGVLLQTGCRLGEAEGFQADLNIVG